MSPLKKKRGYYHISLPHGGSERKATTTQGVVKKRRAIETISRPLDRQLPLALERSFEIIIYQKDAQSIARRYTLHSRDAYIKMLNLLNSKGVSWIKHHSSR